MKRYIRAESSDDILTKIVNMGLEQGLDLSQYVNQYGHFQKYSVLEGLEAGVDVSQYADPKNMMMLKWMQFLRVLNQV